MTVNWQEGSRIRIALPGVEGWPRRRAPDCLGNRSEALTAAGEVATRTGDARGQSYAWGYQGELLEKEHRNTEALEASRKATFAAQKVNAPESLYRWQWQTARLLRTAGKEDEALAAYQRAVTLLKPIRFEYSVGFQNRHHSSTIRSPRSFQSTRMSSSDEPRSQKILKRANSGWYR